MQRTNPLQNSTADEEQGTLLTAEGIPLHKLSAKPMAMQFRGVV